MACNCNYLLFLVWLLTVKTDKHLYYCGKKNTMHLYSLPFTITVFDIHNGLLWIQMILPRLSFNLPTSFVCGWYTIFTVCLPLTVSLFFSFFFFESFHFITLLFLVVAFSFLPREVVLTFVAKLVWWCWTLLTFSCP